MAVMHPDSAPNRVAYLFYDTATGDVIGRQEFIDLTTDEPGARPSHDADDLCARFQSKAPDLSIAVVEVDPSLEPQEGTDFHVDPATGNISIVAI